MILKLFDGVKATCLPTKLEALTGYPFLGEMMRLRMQKLEAFVRETATHTTHYAIFDIPRSDIVDIQDNGRRALTPA